MSKIYFRCSANMGLIGDVIATIHSCRLEFAISESIGMTLKPAGFMLSQTLDSAW